MRSVCAGMRGMWGTVAGASWVELMPVATQKRLAWRLIALHAGVCPLVLGKTFLSLFGGMAFLPKPLSVVASGVVRSASRALHLFATPPSGFVAEIMGMESLSSECQEKAGVCKGLVVGGPFPLMPGTRFHIMCTATA